jgi:chromosome segregation ATPase
LLKDLKYSKVIFKPSFRSTFGSQFKSSFALEEEGAKIEKEIDSLSEVKTTDPKKIQELKKNLQYLNNEYEKGQKFLKNDYLKRYTNDFSWREYGLSYKELEEDIKKLEDRRKNVGLSKEERDVYKDLTDKKKTIDTKVGEHLNMLWSEASEEYKKK